MAKAKTQKLIVVSSGSGYGSRGYHVGQILSHPRKKDKFIVVVECDAFYTDDGLSFGAGEEDGYVYRAWCRPATKEESTIEMERREAQRKEANRKSEALQHMAATWERIFKTGTRPEGMIDRLPQPQYYLDQNQPRREIYGGGRWIILDSNGGKIWAVQNNGGDGDMWSLNNLRTGGAGAIASWIDFDEQLAATIKQSYDVLFATA